MAACSRLLSFVHSELALPQLGGVETDTGEVFVAGIGDLAEGEIHHGERPMARKLNGHSGWSGAARVANTAGALGWRSGPPTRLFRLWMQTCDESDTLIVSVAGTRVA